MPEMKKQFTKGKMNKDLDERLVPNGEYRDAMNIQVATSEGSDVATAQNVLGNSRISVLTKTGNFEFGADCVVVGATADEKLDTLYWLVWTPTRDIIVSYKREASSPVFVFIDTDKDVLKFDVNTLITGVNVIDNMMFWTDNINEPKKINIDRCIQGTNPSGDQQTKLINKSLDLVPNTAAISPNTPWTNLPKLEEKHITVIKKAPAKPLAIKLNGYRDASTSYTAVVEVSLQSGSNNSSFNITNSQSQVYNFSAVELPDNNVFTMELKGIVDGAGVFDASGNISDLQSGWGSYSNMVGKKIVFKSFDGLNNPPGLPVTDYDLKGKILQVFTSTNSIKVEFTSVPGFPPIPTQAGNLQYAVDLFEEEDKLFEFKFPRFSYRYKYEDGEYSPFAPFTQVAFTPGAFDYHPRKGYNIGMTNFLESIELYDFIYDEMPKDVVAVDILFKDEPSTAVYVVDTLRPDDHTTISGGVVVDNHWDRLLNGINPTTGLIETYEITKETVNNILPENQLLRPWDNVPRKALAQDVVGNRVVYGNYVQNYDLLTIDGNKYFADFKHSFIHENPGDVSPTGAAKSCKTLREYQFGVVFIDKYGRETPIISNPTGTTKLEKEHCNDANKIRVGLKGYAPDHMPIDMTYMKFFIKETSNEYYNMAMDRYYDAEDGNVWLAFASSDRNKIDIDTFLILKKGSDSSDAVIEKARYKILAIEAEAPEFIKTSKILYSKRQNNYTPANSGDSIFTENDTTISTAPLLGEREFKLRYNEYNNTPANDLHLYTDGELWVEFESQSGTQISNRYKISNISIDDIDPSAAEFYDVILEKPLAEDANFISDDPTGVSPTTILSGIYVNIYQYKPENLPQFDGRFFVKIYRDEVFSKNIQKTLIGNTQFRIVDSRSLYYLQQGYIEKFTKNMNNWFTPARSKHPDFASKEGTKDFSTSAPYAFKNDHDSPGSGKTGGWYVQNFSGQRVTKQAGYVSGAATMLVKWTHAFSTTHGLVQLYYDIPQNKDQAPVNAYGWMHNNKYCAPALWFTRYLPASRQSNQWGDFNTSVDEIWRVATYNSSSVDGKDDVANWRSESKDYFDYLTFGLRSKNPGNTDYYVGGGVKARPYHLRNRFDDDIDISRDAEVWFIDHSTIRGRRGSNSLRFNGGGSDTTYAINVGPGGRASGFGMTTDSSFGPIGLVEKRSNEWDMQISFGGIAGAEARQWYQEGFYNIGEWNGLDPVNSDYNDAKTKKWCSFLKPGSKFMFLNDPTQKVYTMPPYIQENNYVRHSASYGLPDALTYKNGSRFADSMSPQVGHNHTKSWKIRGITPKIEWNPTQLGEISSGLNIFLPICDINGSTSTKTTSGNQQGPDGNDVKIYVTTIKPDASTANRTNYTATNPPLHVGMALKSFEKIDDSGSDGGVRTVQAQSGSNYSGEEGENTGGNDFYVVRKITPKSNGAFFEITLGGYDFPMQNSDHEWLHSSSTEILGTCPRNGGLYNFVQVGMNGQSPNSAFNINENGYYITSNDFQSLSSQAKPSDKVNNQTLGKVGYVGYDLQIVEEIEPTEIISENPAIWETEPKEATDLEIYYEATGAIPFAFDGDTIHEAFPIGSIITSVSGAVPSNTVVGYNKSFQGGEPRLELELLISNYSSNLGIYRVLRPDGLSFGVEMTAATGYFVEIEKHLYNGNFELPWHNCYSFGNGVESNRIRDSFNLPFIKNGVKVSTTLEQEYKEEHRKYGLIYSGIYNSNSGTNNLNQFIQAEKITKDINPIYGSIQKLHTRDSDLVTLCEDKILRILAQKDALFNADGNTNVTATENVLGQTIPFSGEFGISTNPESFASENYRSYFTDQVRGAVLRLSRDGLTPISDYGMKDWFRDNLKLVPSNRKIIGSYDDRNDEYNVKLEIEETIKTNEGPVVNYNPKVVTYSEKVKGWVSFKSFVQMQYAISMANDYYTFHNGDLYRHYSEQQDRNTFYKPGIPDANIHFTPSTIDVMLNDQPSLIKVYNTLNYEGSQSKVDKFESLLVDDIPFQPDTTYNDQEIYNLYSKDGWYVNNIITDKEQGNINEFIEKEGKWFNNINKSVNLEDEAKTSDFTFQGIGIVDQVNDVNVGVGGGDVILTDPISTGFDTGDGAGDDDIISTDPVGGDTGTGTGTGGDIEPSDIDNGLGGAGFDLSDDEDDDFIEPKIIAIDEAEYVTKVEGQVLNEDEDFEQDISSSAQNTRSSQRTSTTTNRSSGY